MKRTIDDVIKETHEDVDMANTEKPATKQPTNCFSPQLLKFYYEYMFPARPYLEWLSYHQGPADPLWTNREFSFTTEISGQEIYQRYRSFESVQAFRKHLISKVPHKIDIGAVFNKPPKLHKQVGNLIPEQREVIFDIDISDYDDVRTCCQDKKVCDRCWPLMTCAIKVMEKIMQDDFGFQNMLFIFSGRRGIHCWIGDKHSRTLDTNARSAVISYASMPSKKRKEEVSGIHYMIQRSFDICLRYFEECSVADMQVLGHPDLTDEENERRILKFVDLVFYPDLKQSIIEKISSREMDSVQRWQEIQKEFESCIKSNKNTPKTVTNLRYNLMEIVLFYTYPRLDVEVTRHLNHLLKSPFCVHPKTGKLCIPIDPDNADSFSPDNVPTLTTLHAELNQALAEHKNSMDTGEKLDWRSIPLMQEPMQIFRKFTDGLRGMEVEKSQGLDW